MSGLKIDKQVKGGQLVLTRTEHANRAIDLLNALQTLRVSPAGAGVFTIAEDFATLDLSQLLKGAQTQYDALAVRMSAVESAVNLITAAMANATIVCNPDSTITLTFPSIAAQPLT